MSTAHRRWPCRALGRRRHGINGGQPGHLAVRNRHAVASGDPALRSTIGRRSPRVEGERARGLPEWNTALLPAPGRRDRFEIRTQTPPWTVSPKGPADTRQIQLQIDHRLSSAAFDPPRAIVPSIDHVEGPLSMFSEQQPFLFAQSPSHRVALWRRECDLGLAITGGSAALLPPPRVEMCSRPFAPTMSQPGSPHCPCDCATG